MKTILKFKFVIPLIFFSELCLGQIIDSLHDSKDGSHSFENLVDGIIKREISYFNISGGNWESRDSLTKIKLVEIPISTFTDTSAVFSLGKIEVKITGAPFDTLGHKLTYANPKQPYLALIDKKVFWGTDGGIPEEQISSIIYKVGNKTFKMPDSALTNLFEPNFCYTSEKKTECHCRVYQSQDKKRLYIFMLNSDGAGGYEVTWVVEDSKYLMRIVDYGF